MLSIFQRLAISFFSLTNFWQMFYCLWWSWHRGIVVYLDGPDPTQAGSNLERCPGSVTSNPRGEANPPPPSHNMTPHLHSRAGPPILTRKNTVFPHLTLFLVALILFCLLCHMFLCYCVFPRNFCNWWMKNWCGRKISCGTLSCKTKPNIIKE